MLIIPVEATLVVTNPVVAVVRDVLEEVVVVVVVVVVVAVGVDVEELDAGFVAF